MSERGRAWVASGLAWGLLLVAGLGAMLAMRSPRPAEETVPATAFSAERAWADLERIAAEPHPIGTPEHAQVREYLVTVLSETGLEVEVQTAPFDEHASPGASPTGLELANVMVRLQGTDSTGAVMLATHYDSVFAGPGASDAGLSAAALVETVRALRAGDPLRNDVIVLLTDAEEAGLVGARAFVDAHPWADDVDLVLNFEGRGVSGPPVGFEFVDPTSGLLSGYLGTAPRPVASAITRPTTSTEYLRRISDMGEYRRLGIQGIGFAVVGDAHRYHTPQDDVEHASPASMQHVGETALSLARHFGSVDLDALDDGPVPSWTTTLSFVPFVLPGWIAWPLLVLLVAIAAVVVVRVRRTDLRVRDVGIALGALLGATVAAFAIGRVGMAAIKLLSDDARVMLEQLPVRGHQASGDILNGEVFLWAFVAAAAAVVTAIIVLVRRWVSATALIVAALAAGTVTLTGLAIVDPPAAVVLLVPFLFAAAGGLLWVWRSDDRPATAVALGVLGAPVITTCVSLIWLGYLGLTLEGVAMLTTAPVLAAGSLVPQLELTRRAWPWIVPAIFAVAAIALIVAGIVTPSTDPELVRFAEEWGRGAGLD